MTNLKDFYLFKNRKERSSYFMDFTKKGEGIDWFFIVSFVSILSLLALTHPFLKYPFDVYYHLMNFDLYYTDPHHPVSGRAYWHFFWAQIFHLLHLDNTKIFLRAHIVHLAQLYLSFLSVFYFSYTFYRVTFPKLRKIELAYISLASTLVWLTIFATASVGQHLVWFEWYSINYQITLPLTLVVLAWTLTLFFDHNERPWVKTTKVIGILMFSYIIITIHSMEFLYYLMYLLVLILIYIDRIFLYLYRFPKMALILILIGAYLFTLRKYFLSMLDRTPPLITYLSQHGVKGLIETIEREGSHIVDLFNRASSVLNEMYPLSLAALFVLLLLIYLGNKREECTVHLRLIVFVSIASCFYFIPLHRFTAGLASFLTHHWVVNRFYFSSLIFLVLPVSIYCLLIYLKKREPKLFFLLFLGTLFSVTIYSKYFGQHHNYYKNIVSILNSFNREKMGFQLNDKQIEKIGHIVNERKISDKYVYTREDIAFVLRQIYHVKVYLPEHFNGQNIDVYGYRKAYENSKRKNRYLLEVPKGFPDYHSYR